MSLEGIVALAVFVGFGLLGIRSTYRLWRVVTFDGETRRQRILIALAMIATIITAAALWFGFMIVRRAFGWEPLPPEVSVPVGLVVVAAVLAIPTAIEVLVDRIGRLGH